MSKINLEKLLLAIENIRIDGPANQFDYLLRLAQSSNPRMVFRPVGYSVPPGFENSVRRNERELSMNHGDLMEKAASIEFDIQLNLASYFKEYYKNNGGSSIGSEPREKANFMGMFHRWHKTVLLGKILERSDFSEVHPLELLGYTPQHAVEYNLCPGVFENDTMDTINGSLKSNKITREEFLALDEDGRRACAYGMWTCILMSALGHPIQ